MAVELCEVSGDKKTKGIFFRAGAPEWAGALPGLVNVPSERERGEPFSNCVFMSPLAVSVPQHSTMAPLFVWGRERGYSVSIISGSLMFDVVGAKHFLWLGLLFLPPAPPPRSVEVRD